MGHDAGHGMAGGGGARTWGPRDACRLGRNVAAVVSATAKAIELKQQSPFVTFPETRYPAPGARKPLFSPKNRGLGQGRPRFVPPEGSPPCRPVCFPPGRSPENPDNDPRVEPSGSGSTRPRNRGPSVCRRVGPRAPPQRPGRKCGRLGCGPATEGRGKAASRGPPLRMVRRT
jgi:hypothetical protein